MDVDSAADQSEWKSHPGQGEAVTEAAPTRVLGQDLLGVDGIDECPGEHSCTGAKLAEAGSVEEPSAPHGVELEHEEDEGQAAEDERQHHEGLHCLQPAILTDVTAGPCLSGGVPRLDTILAEPLLPYRIASNKYNCATFVNDTTIYGSYYSSENLNGPDFPSICLFDKDMEILGNIWRGVIYTYCLTVSFIGRSEVLGSGTLKH